MRSNSGLALMAGLASGYWNEGETLRKQALDERQQAYQDELRQRDRDEYQRTLSMRGQLADAAAPAVATPVMQHDAASDNIDIGQPGTVVAPTGRSVVDGTEYADPAAAAAAVKAANTPDASVARMAGVMNKFGDVAGARSLQVGLRQDKLASIQLDQAQLQQARDAFNTHLVETVPKGHQAIADLISNSAGDGQNGAMKAKVIPSSDGKTVQYQFTDSDGTARLMPGVYSNDLNGSKQAAFDLQRGMSPQAMYAHVDDMQRAAQVAQKDKDEAAYRQQMLALERQKVALEGSRVAAATKINDPYAKLPAPVREQVNTIDKQLENVRGHMAKAQDDPTWDPNKPSAGYNAWTTQEASLARQKSEILAPHIKNGNVGAAAASSGPLGTYDPNGGAVAPAAAPTAAAPRGAVAAMGRSTAAAPAPALTPGQPSGPTFVASYIAGTGRPDPTVMTTVNRAAGAGDAYAALAGQMAAASRANNGAAAAALVPQLQAARAALDQALGAGGIPPEIAKQMQTAYGI